MKHDRLWVKWIHVYSVKNRDFWTMDIPAGLTWSLRKIWAGRDVVLSTGGFDQFQHAGKYSIQKMYKHLRHYSSTVQWKRITCNSKATPKAIFVTWLALLNRLATKDRLVKWNLNVDKQCVLCQEKEETVQHLFFECNYSSSNWKVVLQRIGVGVQRNTWEEEVMWAAKKSRGSRAKDKVCSYAFTETIYAVWLQRNAKLFRNTLDSSVAVSNRILYHIACRSDDSMRSCIH
ncbi:uncharacterized protein [Spinacia oleracea]|uniref:Reverse transcriptase zinc-binding domain-containing protein n=1 Tax=Spinacia oleracea TaxID=3562 RepID=A0A9R0J5C4_SPIOL|nr:uncharacterized protein LOC110800688 [Spinacia oleracea]